NTAVEPWIQDDWRVSSEFTLNLGLRYEWSGRPVSRNGTISSVVFDSKGPRLITGQNPDGYPQSLAYDDYKNFAPRVGFAYSPKRLGGKPWFARRTGFSINAKTPTHGWTWRSTIR